MFGILGRLAFILALHADICAVYFFCQDFLLHGWGSLLAASASEFAACATQKALHFLDRAWELFGIQWRNFCGALVFVAFFCMMGLGTLDKFYNSWMCTSACSSRCTSIAGL